MSLATTVASSAPRPLWDAPVRARRRARRAMATVHAALRCTAPLSDCAHACCPVCSHARRPSYIEGRLRIAERERQRRLTKQQQQAAAAAAAADAAADGSGAKQSERERKAAAAQADAAMLELLQEEMAEKVWGVWGCGGGEMAG